MKKILIFSLLFMGGCSAKSIIPEIGPETGWDGERISIAYLKTLYKGAPVQITGEYIISGAVVSSDVQGNFYKTLVLDDGTGGIEVKLDLEQIFKVFMIHTRVNVRCNGLWLGSYGGTLQLGAEPYETYQTQYLPENLITQHCRTDTVFYGEVFPVKLDFSEISAMHISRFAAFDNAQFADEEVGMCWADTSSDTDTDRHLIDPTGDTLIVRTSRYARFAERVLPSGSGRIEGVIGYFNGKYQLVVCDDHKATMDNERFLPNRP